MIIKAACFLSRSKQKKCFAKWDQVYVDPPFPDNEEKVSFTLHYYANLE